MKNFIARPNRLLWNLSSSPSDTFKSAGFRASKVCNKNEKFVKEGLPASFETIYCFFSNGADISIIYVKYHKKTLFLINELLNQQPCLKATFVFSKELVNRELNQMAENFIWNEKGLIDVREISFRRRKLFL